MPAKPITGPLSYPRALRILHDKGFKRLKLYEACDFCPLTFPPNHACPADNRCTICHQDRLLPRLFHNDADRTAFRARICPSCDLIFPW